MQYQEYAKLKPIITNHYYNFFTGFQVNFGSHPVYRIYIKCKGIRVSTMGILTQFHGHMHTKIRSL